MEENIKNAIAQIRPYLQRDGGDIQFVEYTDDPIADSKPKQLACDPANRFQE